MSSDIHTVSRVTRTKAQAKESYDKGDLEHNIGERLVFAKDEMDDIEVEAAFWAAAEAAVKAGAPLTIFLERNGWTEEDLKKLEDSEEYKTKLANLKMSQMMAENFDPDQQEGGPAQKKGAPNNSAADGV